MAKYAPEIEACPDHQEDFSPTCQECFVVIDGRPVENDVILILAREFGKDGFPVWALKLKPDLIREAAVRAEATGEPLERAWQELAVADDRWA